ncbi:MAG: N-6 DNA methylase [Tepidisphaeraceae bacterium]|jgi:hypothetical protein
MNSITTSQPTTRRELHRRMPVLLKTAGGPALLLQAASEEMRRLRGLPFAAVSPVLFQGLQDLLAEDDALGRIYQAINSPALEAAYRATARTGRKFAPGEIPAVTQLFTPRWVVEFLLHNTLGRLWRRMHPQSRLNWKWLVPREDSPLPARPARDLRICDPACGTMNFGLVALEMLREMYREEGYTDLREIDQSIVKNNLVGYDIDSTAVDLGRKSLEIKIGAEIRQDNIRVADALFEMKSQDQFDVVVTNPPYLSARNLESSTVARMKKRFPAAWRDYYACFILRSLELLRPGGSAGILCMHSFMFTGAFEKLRRKILDESTLQTAVHFGPGLFDIGNPGTLQTVAMVLSKSRDDIPGIFFRLVDEPDKRAALAAALGGANRHKFEISQAELCASPRAAWMYWVGETVRRVFRHCKTLGQLAPPRQGLATTDNTRFVRYWWEVESPGHRAARSRWIPYAKGGRFCRWFESARHRVDWEDDGRRIKEAIVSRYPYLNGQWSWVAKNSAWYGRSGITYSYLTSASFSARLLEQGTFFDVAGSSLFPDDPLPVLGILNSSTARRLLGAINPTVNFQVGDLRLLPMPDSFPDELRQDVTEAVELGRRRDRADETSPDFQCPATWEEASEILWRLGDAERRIDATVARIYGFEEEGAAIKISATDRRESERRQISYAVGKFLGRWGGRPPAICAQLFPLDAKLEEFVAASIGDFDWDWRKWLSRDFLPWHNRLYHNRPIFWGFSGKSRIIAADAGAADAAILDELLQSVGGVLPAGWQRWRNDPVHLNLAPLCNWIADAKLRASLQAVQADMRSGRFGFSDTAQWTQNSKKELNYESALLR